MIEAVNQPLKPELNPDILAQMQRDLTSIENQAGAELTSAMQNAGLEDPLKAYYRFLGEVRTRDLANKKKPIAATLVEGARNAKGEIEEKGVRRFIDDKVQTGTQKTSASLHRIKERAIDISLNDLKNIGVVLGAAVTGGTIGRTVQEGVYTSEAIIKNVINSILSFTGTMVPEVNPWALLTGVSTGVVYLGIPWYLSKRIEEAGKHTEAEIARQRTKAELKGRADMAIANGEADLRYIVRDKPIFFIQVGWDDPSVRKFASTLQKIGIEPVTFWDDKNLIRDTAAYWMKTGNHYTDPLLFIKANVDNACGMASLVTFGDDTVFASDDAKAIMAHTGIRTDMVDPEVLDSLNTLRLVAPHRIAHIDVTDPQRFFEVAIAEGGVASQRKQTVEGILNKYPETAIVNLNQLTMAQIDKLNPNNIPLEIRTDEERTEEYESRMKAEIETYNQTLAASGSPRKLRYKNPGETNTLTIFYAETDLKTRQAIAINLEEASQEGDAIALINDPAEIGYLPASVQAKGKYICIGSLEADDMKQKFIEAVKKGEIILPSDVIEKMRAEKMLGSDEPDITKFSTTGAGETLLSFLKKDTEIDNTSINQFVDKWTGVSTERKAQLIDSLKTHYPQEEDLKVAKDRFENPIDDRPQTKQMAEYVLQNLQTIKGKADKLLDILGRQ